MRDGLSKLYPNLTPDERFRLALDAIARDDGRELKRLRDTCPRKNYQMLDAQFVDRMEASRMIALLFTVLFNSSLYEVEMAKQILESYLETMQTFISSYIKGANNAWDKAGKKSILFDIDGRKPTDEELEEVAFSACLEDLPKIFEEAFKKTVGELKAIYFGFKKFCENIDIKPEKILALYYPVLSSIESAKTALEGEIPADETMAEQVCQIFFDRWPA